QNARQFSSSTNSHAAPKKQTKNPHRQPVKTSSGRCVHSSTEEVTLGLWALSVIPSSFRLPWPINVATLSRRFPGRLLGRWLCLFTARRLLCGPSSLQRRDNCSPTSRTEFPFWLPCCFGHHGPAFEGGPSLPLRVGNRFATCSAHAALLIACRL